LLFEQEAVRKGQVILLPHVNGSANYRVTYLGGEPCIQRGLTTINKVGLTCANVIERARGEGIFISKDDMLEKIREKMGTTRNVHVGIQREMEAVGALIFDEEEHFNLSVRNSRVLLKHGFKLKAEDEEYSWAQ